MLNVIDLAAHNICRWCCRWSGSHGAHHGTTINDAPAEEHVGARSLHLLLLGVGAPETLCSLGMESRNVSSFVVFSQTLMAAFTSLQWSWSTFDLDMFAGFACPAERVVREQSYTL